MSLAHIEANGNKYRIRLRLGIHGVVKGAIPTAIEACHQADLLKAWLGAVLPDAIIEQHESTLTSVSTPASAQDDAYRALMASPVREGTWQEQIKTAPEWIAEYLRRIMSFPDGQ